MRSNNLTPSEQNILNSLNLRAMKIVKIEELAREYKLPIDMDYVYSMDDQALENALQLFMNIKTSSTNETDSEK